MGDDRKGAAEQRAELDFAGFAQEFLRRNPDYARDYRDIGGLPPDKQEVMARRWGLYFPVPARCVARDGTGVVARDSVSRHRHSRRSSVRIR